MVFRIVAVIQSQVHACTLYSFELLWLYHVSSNSVVRPVFQQFRPNAFLRNKDISLFSIMPFLFLSNSSKSIENSSSDKLSGLCPRSEVTNLLHSFLSSISLLSISNLLQMSMTHCQIISSRSVMVLFGKFKIIYNNQMHQQNNSCLLISNHIRPTQQLT